MLCYIFLMDAPSDFWLWIWILSGGIIFLLLFLTLLWIYVRKINETLKIFFSGTQEAKDFESVIIENIRHTQQLEKDVKDLASFSNNVYRLATKSPYKMGLIRFNPFKDIGGNQSFALSFLDKEKTGMVISSLYTREGTRIYAKPVYKGEALDGYEFSKEEKQAVIQASIKKIKGFQKSEK
ncbi:MAG: DUF4446 family protein [Candidatus Moraniibacteriota bacterium]|nr:MAG: DUF4446 family protein [Candidatus Moranbacteria bacterium]